MPLFRAVTAAASRSGPEPERTRPDAELGRLFKGRPVRRLLAGWALAYAKARVRDRENLRFERTRIFGYARRVFLSMGACLTATGHLEQPDDVFFLTLDELLDAVEGSAVTATLADLVALRRKDHENASRLPDPPERICVRGGVFDAASRMAAVTEAGKAPDAQDERRRKGTACGGGIVEGVARVVSDPTEQQVQAGEILVARHTDPGWISHFANAAAVVGERGSVLSHSAIVSRELGIPCVVAVPGACDWIETGDRLEVDGSAGWVTKLS